jgi:hypothetical protein
MRRAYPHRDLQEVERRAAEVRRQWSMAERIRRTGLPPDMPFRLSDLPERLSACEFTRSSWNAGGQFVVVPIDRS